MLNFGESRSENVTLYVIGSAFPSSDNTKNLIIENEEDEDGKKKEEEGGGNSRYSYYNNENNGSPLYISLGYIVVSFFIL